ncbi:MAG: methyltransferase domain-containing protein [Anaerolineales bacterium]
MTAMDQVAYDFYYRIGRPRWDNGSVPAEVTQLAARKGKSSRALDLGCGTGTHSIYLAEQGFTVVGVDTSPTALQKARAKAAQAGVNPEFMLRDVTRLDPLSGPFDIALDVGCLHGLKAAQQQRYALGLTRLMARAGTLLIWGGERWMGFGLLPQEVEKIFTPAFKLEQVEPNQFHGRQANWYWLRRQ